MQRLIVLSIVLAACGTAETFTTPLPGSDTLALDAGTEVGIDASPQPDVVVPDTMVVSTDTSVPDVQSPDLLSPDTLELDAQQPDSSSPDQGPPDQGPPDTIPPVPDSSVPDALPPDSAPPPDTGPPPCTHPPVYKSCSGGWCSIPKGCFMMGAPSTETCRRPNEVQHEVHLTHDFQIQDTEVTEGMWASTVGYKLAGFIEPKRAANVYWPAAVLYCNALSTKAGLPTCYDCVGTSCTRKAGSIYDCQGYRLPTEAEWEYAYRAGTQTAFYNGEGTYSGGCTGSNTAADAIGWYKANSSNWWRPPKGKAPNAWGLYDMAGNLWEIVHDRFQLYTSSPVTDPQGSATGGNTIKGGRFLSPPRELRAAMRVESTKGFTGVGFRCARTL